ncbi:MAG: hybrid sensor histidine kinase/response regulator [bacterium]
MQTFLVVDDEPDILESIERLFRREYRVLTARSLDDARRILAAEEVHVVMTDQRMPRQSGIEFLAELRSTHPDIVRVLLTGYSSVENVVEAINEGHVYRYIAKPWNPSELRLFVAQAFQHYESRKEREDLVEQLRRANALLGEQNEKLSRANEELLLLDRIKSVFMEVVSHELNTPTAVILGYEFLLRRELVSSTNSVVAKALTGIESSANRLKRISERIFKMLSSESANMTLDLEAVPVLGLIEDVRRQVEPFLVKRGQEIAFECSPDLETITVDREKINDVLVNLIMNAIKFSRDGQTIEVEIQRNEDDDVCIVVRDYGIGISGDDIEQVFAPFFSTFRSQYHSSGEFEFGKRGIGLGLSVTKRFVEMHEGFITVKSSPGQGAEFRITLPRRPGAFDSRVLASLRSH